ncbi:hypothetical protein KY290_023346 [Solanum tuberosum]|uniref:Uncharacterized protein n=1 Tax=Solanum tuberosum TaxID=4113 RepID=A0ABQ7V801_SOLTU|nr:hypothetical protein KY290_023346 [Solanum tuberosum]
MAIIGTKINARIDKKDKNIKNIQMSQMNLEKQDVQVANSLNLRPQGGLPSDTKPKPKQLTAVSTRSGLQLEELAPKKRDTEVGTKEKKVEEVVKSSNVEAPVLQRKLPPPFPQRLKKQNEDECYDFEPDSEVPFILGHPFLSTGRVLIDVAAELSSITVVDHIVESQVVVPEYPLERVLVVHEVDGDTEAQEIETCLNLALYETRKGKLSKLQVDATLRILKRRKKVIGWKIADIHVISLTLCMHRIYMEDDHKPSVQHQRRLNPLMKEVVRKEVIKWLDAGIVYPISDSKWVSPVQCVPKKGGMIVVRNEKNELIPARTVTGWRIGMDYWKRNDATPKDHPIPFIDQMLDRLAGKEYYCFLYGFVEVFMDDISVFGKSFERGDSVGSQGVEVRFRGFNRRFIKDFSHVNEVEITLWVQQPIKEKAQSDRQGFHSSGYSMDFDLFPSFVSPHALIEASSLESVSVGGVVSVNSSSSCCVERGNASFLIPFSLSLLLFGGDSSDVGKFIFMLVLCLLFKYP